MTDAEDTKAKLKKLNAQATALKMDLHDLAEDLPTGWERILKSRRKPIRPIANWTNSAKPALVRSLR